jgi:hypothetical protein
VREWDGGRTGSTIRTGRRGGVGATGDLVDDGLPSLLELHCTSWCSTAGASKTPGPWDPQSPLRSTAFDGSMTVTVTDPNPTHGGLHATEPPSHRATEPPSHRATEPLSHRATHDVRPRDLPSGLLSYAVRYSTSSVATPARGGVLRVQGSGPVLHRFGLRRQKSPLSCPAPGSPPPPPPPRLSSHPPDPDLGVSLGPDSNYGERPCRAMEMDGHFRILAFSWVARLG